MKHTVKVISDGITQYRITLSRGGSALSLMAALEDVPADAVLVDLDFDEETDDEVLIFEEKKITP